MWSGNVIGLHGHEMSPQVSVTPRRECGMNANKQRRNKPKIDAIKETSHPHEHALQCNGAPPGFVPEQRKQTRFNDSGSLAD